MPNRRIFLVMSIASLLPMAGGLTGPAVAQPSGSRASTFVKQVGDQLVAVGHGGGPARAKRAQMTKIIEAAVDVDGVARFCLGRFWRSATPEQQKHFTELFHQVLVTNIT